MENIIGIVLPAVLVTSVGWIIVRLGVLGAEGARGLSSYTFNVAFAALLFRVMRDVRPQDLDIDVLLAYFGGALIVLALGMAIGRLAFRQNGTERVVMGMTGAFSNNGILGIPLVLTTWGEQGLVPLLMIMALHSAILLSLCTVLVEWHRGGSAGIRIAERFGRMLVAVLRHPLLIAILLGLFWGVTSRSFDLTLPGAVELALKWIGDSAIPCGLIVLGASLARIRLAGDLPQIATATAIKLVLQPLSVWLLANHVLGLPPLAAAVVTLTAGMPTAVNVHIFANQYGAFQQRATSIVLLSTALSVVSLSVLLALLT
ncbi:MAG: AEC family transporter [Reyranellaceae bacterium]